LLVGSLLVAAAKAAEPDAKESKPTEAAAAKPAMQSPAVLLSDEEHRLAARYAEFENKLLLMARMSAGSDPKRAALLERVVAQSKEQLVALAMKRLAESLSKDELASAVADEQAVEDDLRKLLELLLTEQRSQRLKDERERLKAQIRKIKELINKQIELQAQTAGKGDAAQLAPAQGRLADDTGQLAREMRPPDDKPAADQAAADVKKTVEGHQKPVEGKPDKGKDDKGKSDKGKSDKGKSDKGKPDKGAKPGEGKPDGKDEKAQPSKSTPGDGPAKPAKGAPKEGEPGESKPGAAKPGEGQPTEDGESGSAESQEPAGHERVEAARKAMERAKKRIAEAERKGAAQDQEQAVRELEQARAQLESILRQLRDEEVERVLAHLESRFRQMLEMQREVYEGTKHLAGRPAEQRTRNDEIESGRLGRSEALIVVEAEKALAVLREEGSGVALPEALGQLRDDMQQVTSRLGQAKADAQTVSLEEEIMAGLEEMIAAVKQAQRDQQSRPRAGQGGGEQEEAPLVDRLAELKMLRSLQLRVNARTKRYAQLVSGPVGQADEADLLDALKRLAEREARIYQATRDIVLEKNE